MDTTMENTMKLKMELNIENGMRVNIQMLMARPKRKTKLDNDKAKKKPNTIAKKRTHMAMET